MAPNPYLMFSGSESKLYTNFDFVKKKIIDSLDYILIYKAKQVMMTKIIPRKVYIFWKTIQVVCK